MRVLSVEFIHAIRQRMQAGAMREQTIDTRQPRAPQIDLDFDTRVLFIHAVDRAMIAVPFENIAVLELAPDDEAPPKPSTDKPAKRA